MPFIEAAGKVKLYFESWGRGTPVVFIHALSMSHRFWDVQVLAVAERGNAIVYDQRGHGRSEKPDSSYDIETYTDDLGSVLDALRLERAIVVGWSIGSWAALDYATRNPGKPFTLNICLVYGRKFLISRQCNVNVPSLPIQILAD
jgi:pimeloyl-ACP methyl ester carboxylesterase